MALQRHHKTAVLLTLCYKPLSTCAKMTQCVQAAGSLSEHITSCMPLCATRHEDRHHRQQLPVRVTHLSTSPVGVGSLDMSATAVASTAAPWKRWPPAASSLVSSTGNAADACCSLCADDALRSLISRKGSSSGVGCHLSSPTAYKVVLCVMDVCKSPAVGGQPKA